MRERNVEEMLEMIRNHTMGIEISGVNDNNQWMRLAKIPRFTLSRVNPEGNSRSVSAALAETGIPPLERIPASIRNVNTPLELENVQQMVRDELTKI